MPGQNGKKFVFTQLKNLLTEYSNDFEVRKNTNNEYQLYSPRSAEINGRQIKDLHFATIKINKQFVGLYFMPVYINPELLSQIPRDISKLLQGKNCFHVKSIDTDKLVSLQKALDIGKEYYQQQGWL